MLFCGIDTSNYTTSAALCDADGNVKANLRRLLRVKEGERGLRQSDAVFEHVRNLPEIMKGIGEAIDDEVVAVGVSRTPRTADGSYMPCFLCGIAAAEAFAAGRGIPVFGFSHQQGHVMAAYSMSGAAGRIGTDKFIAFHVSGGTTELLLVNPADDFSVELIGGTEDLNAGQAIDRTGVAMGMKFPCGPEMERRALVFVGKIPVRKASVKGLGCNLSGLENIAAGMLRAGTETAAVCAFVFDYVGETLEKLTLNARKKYGDMPVVYAGGVMSNSIIRRRLSAAGDVYFTEPCYSADNAVGTALLCRKRYFENEPSATGKN